MDHVIEQLRARRRKGRQHTPVRGTVPHVHFTNDPSTWQGFWVFAGTALIVLLVGWVILTWIGQSDALDRVGPYALIAGLGMALLYYLHPMLWVVGFMLWKRQRPPRYILATFSRGQKFVCLGLIAIGLVMLFNQGYPRIVYVLRHHHWPHQGNHFLPLVTVWWHIGVIGIAVTVILAFSVPWLLPQELKPRQKRFKGSRSDDLERGATDPFGLWLGRSTGLLARLWHRTGLAPDQPIVLDMEDAAQNLLVLGGIGSGKTTRVM
ncbi:MAG: hypothetical protein GY776_02170 [Alteromonas sp.]|nr:hypothetical protein [Alteromonas sp.]